MAAPDTAARTSFPRVYQGELAYVCNALRRLGARDAEVDDLAHDVFLTAYRRYDSYDHARPIRPWLFGIALKRVAALKQRAFYQREVSGELPESSGGVEPAPGAEAELVSKQRRALVSRALDALDLEKRAVLVMHEIDGEPIPEVARALELPLNTAYSRLRRARELFELEVKRLQAAQGGVA